MSGFAFRNRMLKLDIAENSFEIEIDSKNSELMKRLSKEAVAVVKAYQAEEKTEGETIALFTGYINETLRDERAFDKIFKNRMPDLRDCMDVLTYIANEIAAFNRADAFSGNRAQRRAAAKN
jgi:hypothetical protein